MLNKYPRFKKYIRRSATVVAPLFAVLLFIGLAEGQSARLGHLSITKTLLKMAREEHKKTGHIEPIGFGGAYLFTNDITVNGTIYQGLVAAPIKICPGTLVMTSNETFIWIGTNQPPKIIPSAGYRPSFFSNGL